MADQLGSYTAGSTVRIKFTTHETAGGPVAPSSAFEAADLIIYKDGSATQRTSANGITMTSPFDSIVGLHHVDIDLSDDTDAGFYAAGSDYQVVLSADETVDSVAVLKVLAYFSIERVPKVNVVQNAGTNITSSSGRQEVNMTHIAGSSVSTSAAQIGVNVVNFGGSAGTFSSGRPEVNVSHVGGSTTPVTNLTTVFSTDFANNYDTSLDMWKVSTHYWRSELVQNSFALQSVILGANTVNASALASDALAEIADAVWDELMSGHAVSGSYGEKASDWASQTDLADIGTDVQTLGDTATTILGDTNELQTDWADGGRLDLILDARASQTSVDTLTGYVDTEVASIISTLSTIAGYLDTEIAAILADTNELQTDWANGGRLDLLLDAILADTGTDGVVLSAAMMNKIADHVRRRTQANVEASSDGDTLSLKSQYGAIQQMQNSNTTDEAGKITVKKTNGDALGTLTLSTDAAAEPVDGVS